VPYPRIVLNVQYNINISGVSVPGHGPRFQ